MQTTRFLPEPDAPAPHLHLDFGMSALGDLDDSWGATGVAIAVEPIALSLSYTFEDGGVPNG